MIYDTYKLRNYYMKTTMSTGRHPVCVCNVKRRTIV